ncbi:uncharacterized protein LOC113762586 [Coffea eugenioides]|uniref:uncharacterized protein LOC113762586 n=1 Tax=Coffea eugenioides TaxID=49369 RepID=UPI000F6122D7|nr:uncharacterized protein LOC113762586 [Coffea eugenioides]
MRSFGGGSRCMGGGGSGGGSVQMLRSVQRAVRARTVGGGGGAAHEPFSHTHPSTTNTATTTTLGRTRQTTCNNNKNQPITLSSSSSSSSSTASSAIFSPCNNLLPTTVSTAAPPAWPSSCSSPTFTDDSDWECIDDCYEDFVFGTVPSKDEVHHAVFALQEVLDPASAKYLIDDIPAYNLDADLGGQVSSLTGSLQRPSPFGSQLDWMEPSLQLCSQSTLQAHERVHDALHLLRNEPSVQRMVVSLSSDKAVWDAVLNNEVVQELRGSLSQDKNPAEKTDDGSDASDPARDFLSWVIVNTKATVMELVDKITKLVNELFRTEGGGGDRTADRKADPFDEKLRASFLLSVVVMLIVVVARSSKA